MFKSARIKLTVSYVLIMLSITGTFSIILYSAVLKNTERALYMHESKIETRFRGLRFTPNYQIKLDEDAVLTVRTNTLILLTKLNVIILAITGCLGYWFAGITLKPIEDTIEKQKKFTADAAHELKTPLTAMKTELEVNLRNPKLTLDVSKTLLKSIIEEVDSLTFLTNSLLKQNKYENKSNLLTTEVFDLNELILSVTSKFKEKLALSKITLTQDLKNISIIGNKQSIEELLTILIDNAIKFNVTDGSINIVLTRSEHNAVISIEDTGIGISEKDIPYIFDRFYKADVSRTKTGSEGFGLGLSIAKEIVERHLGKISVKSLIDKGTTFTVIMPLKV